MRMMSLTAILAGSATLCAVVAVAQDTRSTAIQGVISQQMEAFKADDFAEAFSYASPMIKQMFGNSDRFGQMVRNGYPMVWRPAQVDFLDLQENAGRMTQRVMVKDATGSIHILDYEMIETFAGWQINGVRVLPAPPLGA